jgi:heptosyltransferase-2
MSWTDKRIGFWLGPKRTVQYSNTWCRKWLNMSAFDDIKRANKESFQYWMSKLVGLPRYDYPINVPLHSDSLKKAAAFARANGLKKGNVVGINPGAGGRWKLKKWTDAGFIDIIARLHRAGKKVLLLGGPDEKDLIADLARRSKGKALSAGTDNALPDFFALVNLCDTLITGDTMALHAAMGLGKKAVAIFGPTSFNEIYLYGRGEKVVTPLPCVCCYRTVCDKKVTSMDAISADQVWQAVEKCVVMRG